MGLEMVFLSLENCSGLKKKLIYSQTELSEAVGENRGGRKKDMYVLCH